MPIVTRSQNKNVSNVPVAVPNISTTVPNVSTPITDEIFHRIVTYPPTAPPIINVSATIKDKFTVDVKNLLDECNLAVGRENRMRVAIKIYKTINDDLDKLMYANGGNVWIRFICTAYNKVMEFDADFQKDGYLEVDKNLLDSFKAEISETKKKIIPIIKGYNGPKFVELVNDTKKRINGQENMRPRRNVPRVNYTGMDSVEPECDDDGITDIWADETIEKDPNYEPSEDDEDEDEHDEEEEEENNKYLYAKVHPELNTEEKAEIKQHISHLIDSHRVRPKRNIPPVNYSGMDMNDEDEGEIRVSKRWFENGRVKYIWKRYALSKANEIGDEDYEE